MKKKIFFFIFSFLSYLFAKENSNNEDILKKLFTSYFQNSIFLQELSLKAEKAALSAKSASVSNGMNISLATGTLAFSFGEGGTFSFVPNASLAIPAANNLRFTASSNVSSRAKNTDVKNTSLSVSVDLYSGARENREVAILKAEREALCAKRDLQNGFVQTECEFYEKLKSLFETASKIAAAKKSLYEKTLEFEQIRVQGYGPSSSKYRLSQMEVLNYQHEAEIGERSFEREAKIFFSECGIPIEEFFLSESENEKNAKEKSAMDFLPKEIFPPEPLDILDFEKENFLEIETAVWTQKINSKTRAAQKAFSLSVNAGYTFANTINSHMTNAMEYGDTIDFGTAFAWRGSALQAGAGISFPTNSESFNPLYKLSLSFLPSQFRLFSIQKKSEKLDAEMEALAIENAKKNYENAILEMQTSLLELQWVQKIYSETFATYSQLERDTAAWYQRGIITQSEFRTAQANAENFRIKILINALDLIIYNDKAKILFARDEELENER